MNKLLKIVNKKVPLGICISIVFVIAALSYSISYNLAMHKFNKVVSYNYEKQQMYSKLSEVDHAIRQEYFGDINEESLINGICNGYSEGLDENNCKYFSSSEYKEYTSNQLQVNDPVKVEKVDNIAYLKVLSLNTDSSNLFINSFQSLQTDDVHKFIIDFRNVNGGDVDQVAKIVNFLLPAGDIVSYVNKDGSKEVEFKSTSDGVNDDVLIICNNNTSGLTEVLVSAMKDCGNVKIVGEKTAGKAIKMKTVQLSDGSAIMFPTAHYITKDGNSLYGMGVIPDVDVPISQEQSELLKNNQLALSDDPQLLAAVDLFD